MINEQEQIENLTSFHTAFKDHLGNSFPFSPVSFKTFQVNLGRKCNQACTHCHVNASPIRTEQMSGEVVDKCLELIQLNEVEIVDITGGAPEMHPRFLEFVTEGKKYGKHIIDRCNLTILEESGYEYLYSFLANNNVEIVASLPHYAKSRTDAQRGKGVFDTSIIALKKLNELGYGIEIPLNLVYNPSGMFLSGDQEELENEFKRNLKENFNIRFNHLYCINNIPINRFLDSLVRKNKFEEYMDMLLSAYNPGTIDGLMCRHQISVGYDGNIYDCDFNQMLELNVASQKNIMDFNSEMFLNREIIVKNHCYGCTAGAGSSCGGAIT